MLSHLLANASLKHEATTLLAHSHSLRHHSTPSTHFATCVASFASLMSLRLALLRFALRVQRTKIQATPGQALRRPIIEFTQQLACDVGTAQHQSDPTRCQLVKNLLATQCAKNKILISYLFLLI